LVQFTQFQTTSNFLSVPLNAQAVESDQSLESDSLETLRQKTDEATPYKVTLATSADFQGPLCSVPDDAERKRLLVVPKEVDSRILSLANEICGQGDPQAKVIRLEEYLRSHHAYSLSYHPVDPTQPLNDFILNNRAAHCQYFASALVIMARAAGVPSRYVTGFYAHESYGSDGMVVRDRDAHAWAECWIDGIGWLTFDPTPSDGLPDAIFADASNWRKIWEYLLDLPRMLREWLADALGHAGLTLATIAATALLVTIGVRAFRSRQPAPVLLAYAKPEQALMELAGRFESWLSSKRIICPPNQTWNECLAEFDPLDFPRQFANYYAQARFGNNPQAASAAVEILKKLNSHTGSKGNESDARS
jgi:hypothetical protein